MKNLLTVEQSATLRAKGVSADKASEKKRQYTSLGTPIGYTPIFTLVDLLSLLPKVLHKDDLAFHYVLTIYWDEDIKVWRTIYDAIGDNIAGDCSAPELIDALYALVCDLLDNHVKLD